VNDILQAFLRMTVATAVTCLSHCSSLCLSVHHTGGSVKNDAS